MGMGKDGTDLPAFWSLILTQGAIFDFWGNIFYTGAGF